MKEDILKNYIIRQLGRTKKKNFENYCITRIYHKLDRNDVQFITQQMFKRDNGKRALADLYFPQINFIIEIDEGHHGSQKIDDESRTKEIINNKLKYFEEIVTDKLEVGRIDVINNSLQEINLEIDKIVDKIKTRIKNLKDNGNFKSWTQLYEKPDYYIKKEYLDTKDKPAFRTLQEVSELFNKGYGSSKGGSQKPYFKDKDDSKNMIWCPQLKLNGVEYNVKWENKITEDGKIIYESDPTNKNNYLSHLKKHDEGYATRYVFVKFRDSSGMDMYRFRGIFKLNVEKTHEKKKTVWEKVGDRIELKGYFT